MAHIDELVAPNRGRNAFCTIWKAHYVLLDRKELTYYNVNEDMSCICNLMYVQSMLRCLLCGDRMLYLGFLHALARSSCRSPVPNETCYSVVILRRLLPWFVLSHFLRSLARSLGHGFLDNFRPAAYEGRTDGRTVREEA